MKLLCVHPGPLMYTNVFLRLEPLGLELVAVPRGAPGTGAADRSAGREPRRLSSHGGGLAARRHRVLLQLPRQRPGDRRSRQGGRSEACRAPSSASAATAPPSPRRAILEHGEGAIDCVLKGEGEPAIVAARSDPRRPRRYLQRARRSHCGRTKGRHPPSCSISTSCCLRAICCATGANISSASSTPAPRSSSRAAARGIARSAAPGPSTGAAIG